MKTFFLKSAKKDSTLELTMYGDIGASWDGTGITADMVSSAIKSESAFDNISVCINSPGGDAFEGVAIYNVLRSAGKPVSVSVDGVAASAAATVAMAGDTITMGTGAMLMIHNASTLCFGEASDMRTWADTLDKVSASMGEVYVSRTGQDAAAIKKLMDAETWMSADGAIAGGFATAKRDSSVKASAAEFSSLSRYRNTPESLKPVTEPEASNANYFAARLACLLHSTKA